MRNRIIIIITSYLLLIGTSQANYEFLNDDIMQQIIGRDTGEKINNPNSETDNIIGEANDNQALFLRETTNLLKPSQKEIENYINYSRNKILGLVERNLSFGSNIRYGITNKLETNIDISWVEHYLNLSEDKDSSRGIGDIAIGAKYNLIEESKKFPDIITAFNITIPTGTKPDPNKTLNSSTGTGRWSFTPQITFVRSSDPAILFSSLSYTLRSNNSLSGVRVSGGNKINYGFGLGISLNNNLSLSGQFNGSYISTVKHNGTAISGNDEPLSFTFSLIRNLDKNHYYNVGISQAMNDDATDSVINLSYTTRF